MPKQQLIISRFEGGLNTDSDPRDIEDNEFSALKGYSVDSLGVIKTMGSHADHLVVTANATVFAEGYGIFPFSSDYDDDGELSSTNYLALTDGTYVHIFDDNVGGTPAWNGMVNVNDSNGFSLGETNTSANDVETSMYAPDGNLRVCDGNFTNYDNLPKRLGYIKKTTYGDGSNSSYPTSRAEVTVGHSASVGGVTQDGWFVSDAMVEQGVPTSNLKMICPGDHNKGIIEVSSGGSGAGGANAINDITAHSDSSTPGTVVIAEADLDFGSLNQTNGYYNGLTCSVFGSGGVTKYGVVVDYVWDGSATTGTFKIWSSPTGDTSFYTQGARDDSNNWGFQVGQEDCLMWNMDFKSSTHNQKNRDVISDDWGVTLTFQEGTTLTGGWMPKSSTKYKFYNSTTFDGKQESLPSLFTMYPRKAASGETAHEAVDEMYFANGAAALDASSPTGGAVGTASTEVPVTFGLLVRMISEHDPHGSGNFTLGNTSFDEEDQDNVASTSDKGEYNFFDENQRVTGGHIWWSSSEDGHKELYLLSEYDLEKGAKIMGGGAAEGAGSFSPWISWVYPVTTNPVVRPTWFEEGIGEVNSPPKFDTYDALFGYEHDTRLNAKWKTATFANNRVYIGNISRQSNSAFNGGGTFPESSGQQDYAIVKQGTIVGSPPGRYDIFPEDPNFEFSTSPGDGDKIVKLESFADRLICFYSNKLEVYSLEKNMEHLELELKYMGLDGENQAQACLTDIGVAWINSYGVHLFNGKQVKTISDKIRNQWIGEDGYTAFWTASDVPAIAYNPRAQKLLIAKKIKSHADDNDILEFSFKTQSWTMKEDALTASKDKRFTIYKGDLVFDNKVRVQTWSDTPDAGTGSGGNVIYTKDIDFGSPGIRKKIYKVYITYRSGGSFTDATCDYNDDPTIAHDDDDGAIKKGMNVTGTGIPSNSYVKSVTSDTSFELNASTTGGSVTNGTLTFNGATNVQVKYGVNGDTTPTETFQDGTNFSSNELDSVSGWQVAELKPTTSATANNIKSFRLAFTCDGVVPAQFEINDITIIYRTKSIK